jgi:hypothetical protein
VRIVGAHEEPHPISVPESLAIITVVAHRSVDPLRHCNHLFPRSEKLQVQLRTEAAIPNMKNKVLFGCYHMRKSKYFNKIIIMQ